jgi:hypothetical protein
MHELSKSREQVSILKGLYCTTYNKWLADEPFPEPTDGRGRGAVLYGAEQVPSRDPMHDAGIIKYFV